MSTVTRMTHRTMTDADHERRHDTVTIDRLLAECPTKSALLGCIISAASEIDRQSHLAEESLEFGDDAMAVQHYHVMEAQEVMLRRYCVALARLERTGNKRVMHVMHADGYVPNFAK